MASMTLSMLSEQRPSMLAVIASIAAVILLLRSRLLTVIAKRAERSSSIGHAAEVVATFNKAA
jgi:hypothetical protein